jgi:hypothetical protein
MRHINTYINEFLVSPKGMTFFCEQVTNMLKGTKLTKDQISLMFNKLELNTLKSLSGFLAENDMSRFVSYQPSDDEFLKEENKDNIISKISDYFIKYIANE